MCVKGLLGAEDVKKFQSLELSVNNLATDVEYKRFPKDSIPKNAIGPFCQAVIG